MNITKTNDEYVADTYARFPVEIVSGKGSIAVGSDGKEYIDLTSGIGVNSLGYCDGGWTAAVAAQAATLQHVSNLYHTEPSAKLAKALCEKSQMKKVFFCNSGAEANEGAIKSARKYAAEKKGADFYTVITLENSFHGRTLATLAATGQEVFHKDFTPLTPGFVSVKPNFEELENAVKNNKTAAVMLECIQGEGGVLPLGEDFLKKTEKLCKEEDVLLIVDEVQTGNGRTGAYFSYMNYGISPDVVTTAKGLGGGLPIGAVLFGEKTENVLKKGDHGSTFGANPVCAAAALYVVNTLDKKFLSEVKKKSDFVFSALKNADGIKSVSGEGLMIGIETERPAAEVINECIGRGVLCLKAKNKVRLLPPLNIPDDLLKKAVDVIKEVCKGE